MLLYIVIFYLRVSKNADYSNLWNWCIFMFLPLKACCFQSVCPSVRDYLLQVCEHTNRFLEFNQIYNFILVGDKGKLIRFWGQKVHVMLCPKVTVTDNLSGEAYQPMIHRRGHLILSVIISGGSTSIRIICTVDTCK